SLRLCVSGRASSALSIYAQVTATAEGGSHRSEAALGEYLLQRDASLNITTESPLARTQPQTSAAAMPAALPLAKSAAVPASKRAHPTLSPENQAEAAPV